MQSICGRSIVTTTLRWRAHSGAVLPLMSAERAVH
jgi:hypothetical protein